MRFSPKVIIKCIFISMGLISPDEGTHKQKTQTVEEQGIGIELSLSTMAELTVIGASPTLMCIQIT